MRKSTSKSIPHSSGRDQYHLLIALALVHAEQVRARRAYARDLTREGISLQLPRTEIPMGEILHASLGIRDAVGEQRAIPWACCCRPRGDCVWRVAQHNSHATGGQRQLLDGECRNLES